MIQQTIKELDKRKPVAKLPHTHTPQINTFRNEDREEKYKPSFSNNNFKILDQMASFLEKSKLS